VLVTNTIKPDPCARIVGSTALLARSGPNALRPNSVSTCAIENASSGPVAAIPALLTSTSMPLARLTTSLMARSTEVSLVTSSSSTSSSAARCVAQSRNACAAGALRDCMSRMVANTR